MNRRRLHLRSAGPIALFLITFACFWPVRHFSFINYDDTGYIINNDVVKQGLSLHGVAYALTTADMSNWHPVTWLSHMSDCELFGVDAGAHHVVNAVIHGLNAVVLWLVLFSMTSSWWRSGIVAGLFALHPLRVESVAWVSERKDLLSALFAFLAIGAYAQYVQARSVGRMAIVAALMLLSLMCKPMMVTLPALLLLLDVWPFKRFGIGWNWDAHSRRALRQAVIEKTPLMAIAIAFSITALIVQTMGGAVSTLTQIPFGVRLANAVIAYGWYAMKSVWPTDLCVLYPYRDHVPALLAVGIGLALLLILAGAWSCRRRAPHLLIGLLWYFGTLVPVIGLVQVGAQSMADRYSYIPCIGLAIIVAWSLPAWRAIRRSTVIAAHACASLVVVMVLFVATRHQLLYWSDSLTLFRHAIEVIPTNHLAQVQVGLALEDRGDLSHAIPYYREAVRLKPTSVEARVYLGNALLKEGKPSEAIDSYRQALAIDPRSGESQHNLANALLAMGHIEQAVLEFDKAGILMPDAFELRYNFGNALFALGRYSAAAEQFRLATLSNPQSAAAHNNRGSALAAAGHFAEAIEQFRITKSIDPAFADVDYNLATALEASGQFEPAADSYRLAIERKPNDALAHFRLARIEERAGRTRQAILHYRAAAQFDPTMKEAADAVARLQHAPAPLR